MKYVKLFEDFITEKKPKGAPDFHHSDAPDAEGRFKELGIKDLAAWLIKTRKKDVKKISGSLTQQIVFNRNEDPKYAEKMEKVRKEVYKQLGREDLLDKMDESLILEIGDASAKPFKWKSKSNVKREMTKLFDEVMKLKDSGSVQVKDRFNYTFKNDNGVEYIVTFNGSMQKNPPQPNFTGKPLPITTKYENLFNLAFNTLEDHLEGIESETNLGDHFRIMSTVTEIVNDFLVKCEDSGYPVKSIFISGKGDGLEDDSIDSRRGRMYMAFIIKQMKNLKTKSDYTPINRVMHGTKGVEIQLGKWSGSSVITTD